VKDTISSILETELGRLKQLSDSSGLELADFRKLEALVKIHRDFLGESQPKDKNSEDPASRSVEELLKDLRGSGPQPV